MVSSLASFSAWYSKFFIEIAKIWAPLNLQFTQYVFTSIIAISTFFVLNVDACIAISKLSILELLRQLMTIVLGFYLSIFCFHLKVLINHFFLFEIICDIFKKSFRFLSKLFFKMWFKKIFCYLALSIVFVPSSFRSIKDKKALRCIQYLEKNVIDIFIILNKTQCFFIHKRLRIIGCYPNFVISKRIRFLVWFLQITMDK